jgi:hypothetical protein
VIVSPVHCGVCGDFGVTETGGPCQCGGPVRSEQVAALRRHGWWATRQSYYWLVYQILDDETDDRSPLLGGVARKFRSLTSAVESLCTVRLP